MSRSHPSLTADIGPTKRLWRRWLHRFVPSQLHNPFGLAARLIRSRDRAAWFAMTSALGGIGCSPADRILQLREQKLIAAAGRQQHPLILICGPPRSGTTIVYHTLVQSLRVGYFNNLSALFPRSPLTAMRLFRHVVRDSPQDTHSYYGRSAGLAGANDALYLWDRWLGVQRYRPPRRIPDASANEMRQFFAAATSMCDLPIVNKNNALNISAHLVANAVEHAHFICLTRQPQDLAESLYRARCDIHGDPRIAYGVQPSNLDGQHAGDSAVDPIESVCDQVAFFADQCSRQQRRIGKERFWIVSYEDFCRAPAEFVASVADKILGSPDARRTAAPEALEISRRQRVAPPIASGLRRALAKRGLGD